MWGTKSDGVSASSAVGRRSAGSNNALLSAEPASFLGEVDAYRYCEERNSEGDRKSGGEYAGGRIGQLIAKQAIDKEEQTGEPAHLRAGGNGVDGSSGCPGARPTVGLVRGLGSFSALRVCATHILLSC